MKAALMDKQAVQGIADTDATGLGIVDDSLAHLQVAVLVEVGVHHTGSCLDDGDAGRITDEVDKLSATTGDTEIHVTYGIEHLARGLMGGRQQSYDVRADTVFL